MKITINTAMKSISKQPNKKAIKKSFTKKLLQSLLLAVAMVPVYADDTEIFYSESEVNNNILFVMDNSGSMSATVPGTQINNGEDYVATSRVNHFRDDSEESDVSDANSWLWGFVSDYRNEIGGSWWAAYLLTLEEYNPLRRTDPNSNNLELGEMESDFFGRTFRQRVALRFADIQVPQGAEITSAYIQFTASNDESNANSEPANLRIKIQNTNNSSRMGTWTQAIRSRSWWGGVNWNPAAWETPNESSDAQETSDLKTLVQQVVNRGGWIEGRAMTFMVEGNGSRVAQSFDFNGEDGAPILTINYAPEAGEKTRLQVMKDALKIVLADAPSNLSVGIMKYGDSWSWRRNYPDGVEFPVKALDSLARPVIEESIKIGGVPDWSLSKLPVPNDTVTVRTYLSEIADSWQARGNTPIVDSLYEASLYFRGKRSVFGDYQGSSWYAAHPSTYARPAPDLFEAVKHNNDVQYCANTPYTYNVWNSSIDSWRNGDSWRKCPADPENPSGPGSKANCALQNTTDASENCHVSEPYDACVSWIDEVTEEVCDDEDESGNPIGCEDVVIEEGYCENDIYAERTDRWCTYKTCRNLTSRNHIADYITPTVEDCQSNNVILMSDGKPETINADGDDELNPFAVYAIQQYMGFPGCDETPFGFKSGRCGSELTHHLAENDINPGIAGDQTIETFVIGFSDGITAEAEGYLKSLVTIEDDPETEKRDGYFSAQNEEELAAAFKQTLDEIAEEARSQASPGYSVNVKSGLEHEDDIYIPVFDKSTGSRWSGNLKKFKLVDEGTTRFIRGKVTKEGDEDSAGYINAMTELGLFKDEAWDEWSKSEIPDGNNVEKGGTASLITKPGTRKLYTNLGTSRNLTHPSNRIRPGNSNIKNEMLFDRIELGLSEVNANKYRKKLVKFIRGWVDGKNNNDVDPSEDNPQGDGAARKHMGDMLHSEPVVITYKQGTDDGVGKEQYVIAATNEGYLHVFDTATGKEKFAFMPQELLKNIHNQYTNEGEHVYGIDGNISYFIKNDNHDGEISGNEEVWLYFGLRRGGRSYYALNITEINNPKLAWTIRGGSPDDAIDDDAMYGFAHLGQSWSAPYIANVSVSGNKKPAIIFTGGNDPDPAGMDYGSGESYSPESVVENKPLGIANGVYIVDAFNGNKLWDIMDAGVAGVATKLKYGIPGGARILDVSRNELLDRLYFADTGGYVWRLDLKEDLSDGSVLTKFASLGGTGVNSRKFYNEPDVAILRGTGKTVFSVSLGSGLRPHPMNEEIEDHMFVLIDESPFTPITVDLSDGENPIKITDLETVFIKGVDGARTVVKSDDFEGKSIMELEDNKGWKVNFGEDGEKVLATSITFEGSLIFTTLVPKVLETGDLISSCAAPATQGRMYAMNLLTGEADMNLDGDEAEEINDNDVFVTISASEIPGTPQRVFNGLNCSNGDCTHDVDIRIGKKSSQAGTTNISSVESIYWNTPEISQ